MLRNDNGFTLIEMIGVLVILSIVVAIGATKYFTMSDTTERVAVESLVSDLNNLEKRAWLNVKLGEGWENDQEVFDSLQGNLEEDFNINGGTFKRFELTRQPSTQEGSGIWEMKE